MKLVAAYKYFLIILVLLSSSGIAQDFFPTQVGNKYQYHLRRYAYTGQLHFLYNDTLYHQVTLVRDTIINGKKFVQFAGQYSPLGTQLYHYNQEEQKLYIGTSMKLAADFNTAAGDSFYSYLLNNTSPHLFISSGPWPMGSHTAYKFSRVTNGREDYFIFVEGIGLHERYHYYEENTPYIYAEKEHHTFKSAIIDTNIYSPIFLDFISLSPLENRTVDDFPFTMTAYYYTNVVPKRSLISSYYVKVYQMRGMDTVATLYYNFNTNNTTLITLTPQVGDRLLLQGYISDHSIFNNVSTYPDTGYAEILVLPSTVEAGDINNPLTFSLYQNYPNPFNPATTITYSIPEPSTVTLTVHDIMGREVIRVFDGDKPAGIYTYEFDGSKLASGVYYYRLTSGSRTDIKKMMLLK